MCCLTAGVQSLVAKVNWSNVVTFQTGVILSTGTLVTTQYKECAHCHIWVESTLDGIYVSGAVLCKKPTAKGE